MEPEPEKDWQRRQAAQAKATRQGWQLSVLVAVMAVAVVVLLVVILAVG